MSQIYRVELNEMVEASWNVALSDMIDEQIQLGVIRTLKKHKSTFMPSPGEFINYSDLWLMSGHENEEENRKQVLLDIKAELDGKQRSLYQRLDTRPKYHEESGPEPEREPEEEGEL